MKCPSTLPNVLGTSPDQPHPIGGVCLDSWCHQDIVTVLIHMYCMPLRYKAVILIHWRAKGLIWIFFFFFFNRFLFLIHQIWCQCCLYFLPTNSDLQMAAFWETMWLFNSIQGQRLNFAPSFGPDYTPTPNSSEGLVYWCIWLWCKGQVSHDRPAGQWRTWAQTWLNRTKII